MRKLFLTLTIPLFTMAIAPAIFNAPAQAETKTFNRPRTRSVDLDWCLTWDANCGEPAAKAFCSLFGSPKCQIAPLSGPSSTNTAVNYLLHF